MELGQELGPNGGKWGSTMGWMPPCCGAPASGAEARGGSRRNRIFGLRDLACRLRDIGDEEVASKDGGFPLTISPETNR